MHRKSAIATETTTNIEDKILATNILTEAQAMPKPTNDNHPALANGRHWLFDSRAHSAELQYLLRNLA